MFGVHAVIKSIRAAARAPFFPIIPCPAFGETNRLKSIPRTNHDPCDELRGPSVAQTILSVQNSHLFPAQGLYRPSALQPVISKAVCCVVVHHADRLHECITDCRADEAESSLLKILAHGGGQMRCRRNLRHGFPGILFGNAVHITPEIRIQ